MTQRRFHYELAFEHYLRANTVPYVAVDEAKRALQGPTDVSLKSFDFVVYSRSGSNLLLDVKGRKQTARSGNAMQNWVTQEDIDSLTTWEQIFGSGFEAAFAFLHWCEAPPADMLFQEMFEFSGKWYAISAVKLCDYKKHMTMRSKKWETVCVPSDKFRRITQQIGKLV